MNVKLFVVFVLSTVTLGWFLNCLAVANQRLGVPVSAQQEPADEKRIFSPSSSQLVKYTPESKPVRADFAKITPDKSDFNFVWRGVRVTAYCPCKKCCGSFADGITASLEPVAADGGKFVAAPRHIPFHTKLDIPGYGRVRVLDRGGAIKGDRLDVFFPTHQEALEWGVKYLDVRSKEAL